MIRSKHGDTFEFCSSGYSSGLRFAFACLHQYVRGYPGCSAWTVHEYCCIQMIIKAKCIHKVAESEGGDRKP